jgi:hypothetical protein
MRVVPVSSKGADERRPGQQQRATLAPAPGRWARSSTQRAAISPREWLPDLLPSVGRATRVSCLWA